MVTVVNRGAVLASGAVHHLAGSAEVAALLRVSRQRVHRLAKRADFPEPVAVLSQGKVWERAAVEAWARANGRLDSDEP